MTARARPDDICQGFTLAPVWKDSVSTRPLNILEAKRDPVLFGQWFKDPESWRVGDVLLAALFGLPITEHDAAIFAKHIGRAFQARLLVRCPRRDLTPLPTAKVEVGGSVELQRMWLFRPDLSRFGLSRNVPRESALDRKTVNR